MKKMRGTEETFRWIVLGWNGVLMEVRKHLEKLSGERAFWTGRKMTLLPSLRKENLAYTAARLHSGLGLVSSSRVSSAMLWGRHGSTVSGIVDKATSGKNFYHQKKKGEQKTGEIELVCVCVCLKGRMFCSTLLRKSLEENSVGLGQEELTQKNVRNQNRR